MSCQIKNTTGPPQIQCSFPDVGDGKGDFSVYFHPFDGPAAQLMVSCTRNERRYACTSDEVVVTQENLNTATITVTETFAKKKGTFSCQRGDIPVTKQCQFPFSENVSPINSFNSDGNHGATARAVSTLNPEQFENRDGNTTAIIGVTIALGGLLILSLVIGILLYRRHKLKKRRERSANSERKKSAQSVTVVNEGKKKLLLKDQFGKFIRPKRLKEINTQISGDEHGSTVNKPQENGSMGQKSAECKRNDSGSGLEKESGSSPSGNEESNSPLLSRDKEKNQLPI